MAVAGLGLRRIAGVRRALFVGSGIGLVLSVRAGSTWPGLGFAAPGFAASPAPSTV
jgi:hypothetical protein